MRDVAGRSEISSPEAMGTLGKCYTSCDGLSASQSSEIPDDVFIPKHGTYAIAGESSIGDDAE